MNTWTRALALCCALGASSPAFAATDTLFDSGPIDGAIGFVRFDSPLRIAAEFSVGQAFLPLGVSLGVWVEPGTTLDGFSVSILDGAPGVGAAVIGGSGAYASATLLPGLGYDGFDVYDVRYAFSGTDLAAGTYFLQLEALATGGGAVGWDRIDGGGPGRSLYYDLPDLGVVQAQEGEFVSFRLLGEFSETATPTVVPEPAAWALLIAGFGLAGAALRRRRACAPPS